MATNGENSFPDQPFDYILFFNDPGLLDDDASRLQLARSLEVLGRPFSGELYDFDDVTTVLSALADTGLEVSYCGYRDALVAQTVNRLVRTYGGASYYVTEDDQLSDIIGRDFDYFARPALSNVSITLHTLGATREAWIASKCGAKMPSDGCREPCRLSEAPRRIVSSTRKSIVFGHLRPAKSVEVWK